MATVPRPLRLVIVNDYSVVVAGVAALLAPYADRVVVEAYVGELPPEGQADVVLFDPFGHAGSLERLGEIVRETGTRVLVYTWAVNDRQVAGAIAQGAAGVLAKSLDGAEILAAVEAVAAGEVLRPTASGPPGRSLMADWPGRAAGLSAREAEVVALISTGMANAEISEALFLGLNSVKTYIRSAYRKMGVSSRSQAVLWGLRNGLVAPGPPAPVRRRGLSLGPDLQRVPVPRLRPSRSVSAAIAR